VVGRFLTSLVRRAPVHASDAYSVVTSFRRKSAP
jgi:hypothetical protein